MSAQIIELFPPDRLRQPVQVLKHPKSRLQMLNFEIAYLEKIGADIKRQHDECKIEALKIEDKSKVLLANAMQVRDTYLARLTEREQYMREDGGTAA